MLTYKIHLIRCGVCEGQSQGLYIGHTDSHLTDESRAQLELAAQRYETPDADVVLSSPLSRCVDTARIFYPDKEIVPFDAFIEYDFGEFEGHSAADLASLPEFMDFLSGSSDKGALRGETNGEFQQRVTRGFASLVLGVMREGIRNVAVFTHSGVIGTILAEFAVPQLPMTDWKCRPGEGFTLSIIPEVWSNVGRAEVWDTIPPHGGDIGEEDLAGEDPGDVELDPEEFRGFYTPGAEDE